MVLFLFILCIQIGLKYLINLFLLINFLPSLLKVNMEEREFVQDILKCSERKDSDLNIPVSAIEFNISPHFLNKTLNLNSHFEIFGLDGSFVSF